MNRIALKLPKVVIDTHAHGRDRNESHKTTVEQVLREARSAGIGITCFMPNTDPPITNLGRLNAYLDIVFRARRKLGLPHRQYIWFGATDDNLDQCAVVLNDQSVVGIKVYPKKRGGNSVTTGKHVGVSNPSAIVRLLELSADTGKPIAFHCEDPLGAHDAEDEIRYIEFVLDMARHVKRWYGDPRIVICHVSTEVSVGLIVQTWAEGLKAGLELSPHHLWFSDISACHRAVVETDSQFLDCYPPLRSHGDVTFLRHFLQCETSPLVWIGSDSACHTREEKLAGARGIPSNQEMIAVAATLTRHACNHTNPNYLANILSRNAAAFLGLDVPRETVPVEFEEREDDCVYNNGVVVNPWLGQKLYFPVRN